MLLPKKNHLSPIDGDDPETMPPVCKRIRSSESADCEDIFYSSSSAEEPDEPDEAIVTPTLIRVTIPCDDISHQIRQKRNTMRKLARDALSINSTLDSMLHDMRKVSDELVCLANKIDAVSAVVSVKI